MGPFSEAGCSRCLPSFPSFLCTLVCETASSPGYGYTLSPIDLIPDFIPIFGYLDDLLLVPLGILLVIRLVPAGIMTQHRAKENKSGRLLQSWIAVVYIHSTTNDCLTTSVARRREFLIISNSHKLCYAKVNVMKN